MKPALLAQLLALPYSQRDEWLDELFGFDMPSTDERLPPGAVPYLPCGVDAILAMVREAPVTASDHFVDIGAGIGRVVIVTHLLSGARTHGIEIQASLVEEARRLAADWPAVTFTCADAAATVLDGSRFFLYAPCNGALLARVVQRLHAVARRRPIVIGTVDFELPDVPWLKARPSSCAALTLYDSRSDPGS